jgi:hypothetical protein
VTSLSGRQSPPPNAESENLPHPSDFSLNQETGGFLARAERAIRGAGWPGLLLLLAVALVGTAVRGAYAVDENNYLATLLSLRAGGLSLPGTALLTPSAELYWFDPIALSRTPQTPLVSTVPPLWAFLALPFSPFGWYGLIALNALAFAATVWLVHRCARTLSDRPATASIAAAALLLGGYSIEYAQGLWPHCLAMALCTGAVVLAARARLRPASWPALASGALVGLATGVRYQNIVLAALLGLGLLVLGGGGKRWRRSLLFALGVAGPLLACSLLNHARLGWWNPVSKGPGYVSLEGVEAGTNGRAAAFARVLYAKVVDFSTHAPMGGGPTAHGADRWRWEPDPELGAYIVHGAVKKAWLQSSPWVAMSLLLLVLAWRPRPGGPSGRADEERALSLVLAGVLVFFGLSGAGRLDGLCANQRYLLELGPIAALALGLGLDRVELPRRALLGGGLFGLGCALFVLWPDLDPRTRVSGLLHVPLALAAASAATLLAVRLGPVRMRLLPSVLAGLLGASLSWAAAVHLGDDLPAAYRRRLAAASLAERWASVLPERAALFVHFAGRDASAPLHLGRDLLLVDPWLDGARDAPRVAEELLRSGRRVFIDRLAVPEAVARKIQGSHPVRVVLPGDKPILELLRH